MLKNMLEKALETFEKTFFKKKKKKEKGKRLTYLKNWKGDFAITDPLETELMKI